MSLINELPLFLLALVAIVGFYNITKNQMLY